MLKNTKKIEKKEIFVCLRSVLMRIHFMHLYLYTQPIKKRRQANQITNFQFTFETERK
jgi:hypothetical protein